MADQKNTAPVQAAPTPAKLAPAARAYAPRRNVGWCVAVVQEGQTLQDVPRDQIIASAQAHEAKWKGRFNAQQQAAQANMNWSRG
jgi:hypothetical protein